MRYISEIVISGVSVNYAKIDNNARDTYKIRVNLYDPLNSTSDYVKFKDLTNEFGVERWSHYTTLTVVTDVLWKFLDYAESPEQIGGSLGFVSRSDFLTGIGADDLVLANRSLSFLEYKGNSSSRHIVIMDADADLMPIDANKIFWLNRSTGLDMFGMKICGTKNVFNLLDIYKRLMNSSICLDKDTEVYLFSEDCRYICYRLILNDDIMRFLVKLKVLGG